MDLAFNLPLPNPEKGSGGLFVAYDGAIGTIRPPARGKQNQKTRRFFQRVEPDSDRGRLELSSPVDANKGGQHLDLGIFLYLGEKKNLREGVRCVETRRGQGERKRQRKGIERYNKVRGKIDLNVKAVELKRSRLRKRQREKGKV